MAKVAKKKKKGSSDKTEATAAARIGRRIKPVEDASPYAKVLVYGRNKNGKTVFASTAPKCLIVDVNEEGSRSAAGSGTKVIECKTFDDVAHTYWYLKAGNHDFESVALDTITALQDASLRKVLGEAEDRDPTREPSTPDQRTYGRANQLTKQLLLQFRNLPMHVVFLAQEKVITDEDEETTVRTVQITPGVRTTALGCVGVIGRIYLKEVKDKKTKKPKWEARMLVGPHEEYDTGNRIELPRIIRADMGKIIKQWAVSPPEEED